MEIASAVLGLGADGPAWWQMAIRACLVFVVAVALVRLGEKRFLGKSTAFDVIIGIVFGSLLSGAITGSAGFGGVLVAAAVLVTLHWLAAVAAFHWSRFGTLVKGSPVTLVEDGEIRWEGMRNSHISHDDLLMHLRTQGSIQDPGKVRLARLERSGNVSVIEVESNGGGGSDGEDDGGKRDSADGGACGSGRPGSRDEAVSGGRTVSLQLPPRATRIRIEFD